MFSLSFDCFSVCLSRGDILFFLQFSWLGYPAISPPIEGLMSLSFELVGWETSGHDGLGTYGYTGLGICVRMFQ